MPPFIAVGEFSEPPREAIHNEKEQRRKHCVNLRQDARKSCGALDILAVTIGLLAPRPPLLVQGKSLFPFFVKEGGRGATR